MGKMLLLLLSPVIALLVGIVPVVVFHIKYLKDFLGSWWRPNHSAYLGLISLISASVLLIMAEPNLRIYSDFIMFLLFYGLGIMLTLPSNKIWSRRLSAIGLYILGITSYISHLYGGRGTIPALTFSQMWLYQNSMGMNALHFTSVIIVYFIAGVILFVGIRFAIARDDILTESFIVSGYSLLGSYMYFGGISLLRLLISAVLLGLVVYGFSEFAVLLIWSFTGKTLEESIK